MHIYSIHKKFNQMSYTTSGTEPLLEMESEGNDCDIGLTGNLVTIEDTTKL